MRTHPHIREVFQLIIVILLAVVAASLASVSLAASLGYAPREVGTTAAPADMEPLAGVSISGPDQVSVNNAAAFTATVSPVTATQPITFVWEATGQLPVTHTASSSEDASVFTWDTAGTQVITVTATNLGGTASTTHTLTTIVVAPESVAVSGPALGVINAAQSFTATVTPLTATMPITYVWEATGQSPLTHTASSPNDSTSFIWPSDGQQAITVTAQNEGGAVSASLEITIVVPNPVPILASISPTSAVAGGSAFTLTVTGTGFVDGSIVRWNGSDRATSFVSATQLQAWIAAADLMVGSPAKVSVFNPAPGGGESNTLDFVIRHYLYLPLIMKRWPPIPDVPVLYAINNAGHDPSYLVTWNTTFLAESYTLQEDTDPLFPAPITVYTTMMTNWSASGKAPGTYYYRVMATNSYGDSGWSNVQSTVVWPPLPATPTLNAISNADLDGEYQITWSSATYADSYTLEEATNSLFLGAVSVYNGAGTQWTASAKAANGYYYRVKASNLRGDSNWSGTQIVNVLAGIHGQVTYNGSPASGVNVLLRFYNGSSWSTYASMSTPGSGWYSFASAPTLAPGQKLYVRYTNSTDSTRLADWWARELSSYSAGTSVNIGNFDVANISMVSPSPGATVALPYAFTWTRRTNTISDSYVFNLFELTSGGLWAYTNPLGYVSGVTVNSLPSGFYPNTQYGWFMSVWSPDQGYGESYYYRRITFSNSGLSPSDATLRFRSGSQRDEWRPNMEEVAP